MDATKDPNQQKELEDIIEEFLVAIWKTHKKEGEQQEKFIQQLKANQNLQMGIEKFKKT
jgi:phosphatidylserine/phosphatidylglycerophosphate/cardiolipin synthase-like enzyme